MEVDRAEHQRDFIRRAAEKGGNPEQKRTDRYPTRETPRRLGRRPLSEWRIGFHGICDAARVGLVCEVHWAHMFQRRWNKLMHILHGNDRDDDVTLRACNIDGMQREGRWEFVVENTPHFMALSETHATLMQQKELDLRTRKDSHEVLWGAPVGDRRWSGMAFVYRKCARSIFVILCVTAFGRMGDYWRLYRSDEHRSIVIYVLYGWSGARWEMAKKAYDQQLIQAVQDDATRRGDLPMVICGDFNLEITDAPEEFETLKHARWVDCASWGIGGFDSRPTSLKGRGSRIDAGFVNQTAASLMRSYDLLPGGPHDHAIDVAQSDCESGLVYEPWCAWACGVQEAYSCT